MFRPAGFKSERLRGAAELDAALANGPVLLMTETPTPPDLPSGTLASLIYSEFPLARFGFGASGTSYIAAYRDFAARHRFLKLLPLYWYTLYRVERSATIRS
jgi:hypothetical protein